MLHKKYSLPINMPPTINIHKYIFESFSICDLFWENVPKCTKTTIEIRLKAGNNFILNKYLKPIVS